MFSQTASPINRVNDFSNNNNNENKFQSSRDFSNQNYETFPPMFSETFKTFTENPSEFKEEKDFSQPPPQQYFFSPINEYTPTRSYQRDEL